MDSADGGPKKRPFQPVLVGNCYAQTADDRFGSGASEVIRERERFTSYFFGSPDGSALDWDESGSDDETSIYQLVPTMQRYRNNLTALSQLYNLYLVAYQGKIFAYVPRSVPKQTIPRRPDLRIAPRPTEASRHIGGYQEPTHPHTINHIIVGPFGKEEVVVACYDDGDVIGYLTSEMAACIASRPRSVPGAMPVVGNGARRGPRSSIPKPFLHENVGKSAWGLAVHEKSRLIAVSSNRCEVTVFALSLAPSKKGGAESESCECRRPDCEHVEMHVRQRARNWKIVVALGRLADKIPNLCFVDDDQGLAEMICAIDIRGAIWLADIWRPFQAATRVEPCNCVQLRNSDSWPALSRGWGILALPKSCFLKVDSIEELLGASGRDVDVLPNATLNMESHLQDVPDNPCSQDRVATLPNHFAFGAGADQVLDAVVIQPLYADGSQHSDSDGLSEEAEAIEGVEMEVKLELDALASTADGVSDIAAMLASAAEAGEGTQPMTVQQLLAQSLPAHVVPAADIWPMTGSDGHWGAATTASNAATDPPPPPPPPQVGAGVTEAPQSSDGCPAASRRDEGHGQGLLDMMYLPHEGRVLPMPQKTLGLVEMLRAEVRSNRNAAGEESVLDKLAKRYHVLRLHEKEMELRRLDQGASGSRRELGVLCPRALNLGQGLMSPATRLLFRATSRLSMVVHVAELSLVVVGSPIGRVLLVTPTRLARAVDKDPGQLQHGMRVDWVLPRRSDETLYRRVARPLHGMAVGPVQETGAQGDGSGPRRYRLMLHYRNHDVLTYEITREEETGKLCIF